METGLAVLNVFLTATRPLMLKEVASAAQMHPAKTHRYLVSLARMGFVEREANGRYVVGQAAIRLGLMGLGQTDPLRLVPPVLDRLWSDVRETVLVSIWGSFGPTVVQWRDSPHPITVNARAGTVLPLLSSATGHVFLTYLRLPAVDKLIVDELRQLRKSSRPGVPKTPQDVEHIRAQTRHQAMGRVGGSLIPGISALSAPVFNHDRQLVMAITAIGNERTFKSSLDGMIASSLRESTAALSRRLGFIDAGI